MVSDPMKAPRPMIGAVLHHPVIVAGDGARADIGARPGRIADIAQVVDLGPVADLARS
jgi:hypothetical protein